LGLLSSQLGLERADRALSKGLYYSGALGARQELRHVLVLGSVVRPRLDVLTKSAVAGAQYPEAALLLCCCKVCGHSTSRQPMNRGLPDGSFPSTSDAAYPRWISWI
jgi:hypothetical protein